MIKECCDMTTRRVRNLALTRFPRLRLSVRDRGKANTNYYRRVPGPLREATKPSVALSMAYGKIQRGQRECSDAQRLLLQAQLWWKQPWKG